MLQQESIDGVPLALLVGLSVGEVDNSRFFRTADDSISLECHDVTCISYCLTVTFDSESDRLLSLTGNAHEEHRLVCCSRCCYELFTSYHLAVGVCYQTVAILHLEVFYRCREGHRAACPMDCAACLIRRGEPCGFSTILAGAGAHLVIRIGERNSIITLAEQHVAFAWLHVLQATAPASYVAGLAEVCKFSVTLNHITFLGIVVVVAQGGLYAQVRHRCVADSVPALLHFDGTSTLFLDDSAADWEEAVFLNLDSIRLLR